MTSMLAHDLWLALRSLRRTPALTALMIGAVAAGIGAALVTMTLYHARSGNPIWWKSDRLHAVTLDLRDADRDNDRFARNPEYPPPQLTYRDAHALYRSKLPTRQAMMFKSRLTVDPPQSQARPFNVQVRVTTADFFAMFDVPFRYGGGWTRAADEAPEAVVVLGQRTNERLFAGQNSIGRMVTLSGHDYRVVGVLDHWLPQPKFYDVNNQGFDLPEDVFMPFGWTEARELRTSGNTNCLSRKTTISSFRELLNGDCVWLQFWAELPSASARAEYQQFVDNYVTEQKRLGRFPRPLNNRIVDVAGWLEMQDVVGNDSRIQVVLALLFLGVCIFNTVGLLLAKFHGAAPIAGLRRALGASRRDIVRQHVIEALLVGVAGGAAGLAFAVGGLRVLRQLLYMPNQVFSSNPTDAAAVAQSLTHLDSTMLAVALAVSILTGLAAGGYPAWRLGRMPPALFLKSQ
jgi:putative ABC transport system permease protein